MSRPAKRAPKRPPPARGDVGREVKSEDVLGTVIAALRPLSDEERERVLRAACAWHDVSVGL